MSTAALSAPRAAGFDRPGLGRLTLVELRKMTDTRAGFWLLAATAGLTAVATIIACFAMSAGDRNLLNLVAVAAAPASVLLPVVGVLLVSSEWSQRTAMITFALVPRRSRVMAAKVLAALALALVAWAIALVVALIATAAAGADGDATWSFSLGLAGQVAFSLVAPMLIGVAFGALLLSSAPAIVLYFALPLVFGALGAIPALTGTARWLDQSRTLSPLTDHALSATEWARVGTSLALWVALPLALGLWRVVRSDVR